MIIGIGIDLMDVKKIEKSIRMDAFLKKVFTVEEVNDCRMVARPAERFAGKFAAKEACMKALGHGIRQGVWFTQIEIVNDENGAPYIRLMGEAEKLAGSKEVTKIHVTITHTKNMAAAVVVLENNL
jgi:holo-[acyl-carrier protein] synthase